MIEIELAEYTLTTFRHNTFHVILILIAVDNQMNHECSAILH